MLHPIIASRLPVIVRLFKMHKVKRAYAFGSVLNDDFNEQSDIDLLVDFDDTVNAVDRGRIWWELHDDLRAVFNREIDLLIDGGLKNPYLQADIDEKKQLIYAA